MRKKAVLLLFLCCAVLGYSQETGLCGDVNGDEAVNIVDSLLIARYYVGLDVDIDLRYADVDSSGDVNIVDALSIARMVVGLIVLDCEAKGFPCLQPDPGQKIDGSEDYSLFLGNQAEYDLFSQEMNSGTPHNLREVKFMILNIRNKPALYFINTKVHAYHYDFTVKILGHRQTLREFNSVTYFNTRRENIAGTIVFYEHYEENGQIKGAYSIEFCPSYLVLFKDVQLTYQMIGCQAPLFTADNLFYHPVGPVQEHGLQEESESYAASDISLLRTEELYKDQNFNVLNPGEGIGLLRIYGEDTRPLTVRDIVILDTIPNEMSHVGGIITTLPQTPLSHINLKAKQNNTPNIYIKGALENPEIYTYLNDYVHFKVDQEGYQLRKASREEYLSHLDKIRPNIMQYPKRDLSVREIRPLTDIDFYDSVSFGAKASNVAELLKILPEGMVPRGFAVPFYFYDKFMTENQFYRKASEIMAEDEFQNDPEHREKALKDFRKLIKKAEISTEMAVLFDQMHRSFPEGQSLRCRSSTNNEDLEGFSGAGLYDSKTHHPDEGHISKTIKQVWAGLWTFRAFEEREFYRIDHFNAAMGVLVHPNFKDEKVNGVSVTKNIYDTNAPGYYVNAQLGEDMVTNPDERSIPEEFIILKLEAFDSHEVIYLRRSNKITGEEYLLNSTYINQLTEAMRKVHDHFILLYQKYYSWNFAMDLEFKVDKEGALVIKQARPWVD